MPRHRLVAPRGKGGKKAILDARHDRTFMKLSKMVDKEEWQEVLGHFPENAKAEKLLALLSKSPLTTMTPLPLQLLQEASLTRPSPPHRSQGT